MQERLRANGLFKAKIDHRVDLVTATTEASVYFELDPGKRARFDGVQFIGDPITPMEEKSLISASEWGRGFKWLRLPGWQAVNESRMQTGIGNMRRQLQQNDRLEARVTLDHIIYNSARNRVTPVLSIERGPIVEVRAIGAKVKDSKLRDLIPIYQERTVDQSLLVEGRRNLTENFQSHGYFDVMVDVQEKEQQGRSLIEYMIERGEKHTLRRVIIMGNTFFDTETLRERMYIEPASRIRYRSGRYSPRMLTQDVNAIKALYQSNGFRDVEVTSEVDDDPISHGAITVKIQIVEGRQWYISDLQIAGMTPEDEINLRPQLRSTERQLFSAVNIAADRDLILTYYFNNGYPDAAFDWTQNPGEADGYVDLKFTVTLGKRQFVRGVLVRGLETTRASLVASRIKIKAGDPLSQSQISESQQALYDLGIFAKVETAIMNPDGSEDSKYVIFHEEEARKYSFNLGVGAQLGRIGGGTTTLNSPAGTTGFAPRVSVGISRINFLGIGHTVSLQTQTSTQQKRALLTYLAPQFQGNPDLSLTFSALFNDARDIRTFAARRWEGTTQLSRRFTKANTGQIRYTFRKVTLRDIKIVPDAIPIGSRDVRVGLVGGTFFRDRRDDPVDSHRGSYNNIDVSTAASFLGSQTSFTRVLARNSTYHSLTRDLVFARTVQFGTTQRIGGLPGIPLSERFYSGGSSSHRGFPDNQAGPRDQFTGFPIGGNAILILSEELRFPLIGDNLGGVLFHDWGNVYSEVGNISFRVSQRNLQDFDYMVHAIGGGLRYKTFIGPVRIDLAYGPNTPRFFGFKGSLEDLEKWDPNTPLCTVASSLCTVQRINRFQFHFSLGQTF
jgi:outer membrane protein assembly complex protein YaeT